MDMHDLSEAQRALRQQLAALDDALLMMMTSDYSPTFRGDLYRLLARSAEEGARLQRLLDGQLSVDATSAHDLGKTAPVFDPLL